MTDSQFIDPIFPKIVYQPTKVKMVEIRRKLNAIADELEGLGWLPALGSLQADPQAGHEAPEAQGKRRLQPPDDDGLLEPCQGHIKPETRRWRAVASQSRTEARDLRLGLPASPQPIG